MNSNEEKEILNRIINRKKKGEIRHVFVCSSRRCSKQKSNKELLDAISLVREKYIGQDEVDISFLFELKEFEDNVKNGLAQAQNS